MSTSGTFSLGRWRGLVKDDCRNDFTDLDQWLTSPPGDCVVQYPCREVRRLQLTGGRVAYAKIIRALTDAGLQKRELFSWGKWVFRPSRAIATWHISRKLLAAGFLCPEPLLAVRRRDYGYPTDIFVSAEVPFPDLWADETMQPDELAKFVGSQLAEFHQAGFAHGDCILRNMCREPELNRLVYLDNDRTWRPCRIYRRHYQMRNLAQMTYSFLKRFDNTAISRAFLDAYNADGKGITLNETEFQKLIDGAIRRKNLKRKS